MRSSCVFFIKITLVIGIIVGAFFTNQTQRDVVAFGCDNYGYLRQAQLFREKGFIAGFDSAVKQEQIKFLIDVAKKSDMDSSEWGDSIAPDCHHYISSSDNVINQYPAGTGMIMSLFPESKAQPFILIIGTFFVCMVLLIAIKNMDVSLFNILLLVISSFAFFFYINNARSYASQSVVFTILLIPLLCFINNRLIARTSYKWVLIVLSSLVCGLLFNVRVPNIFIGVMTFFMVFSEHLIKLNVKKFIFEGGVWSLGFFVAGVMPYSFYSWTNTGGLLNSTYDSHDLKISFDKIPEAIGFYLSDPYSSVALLLSLVVIVCSFYISRSKSDKPLFILTIISFAMFLVNIAFFSVHAIHNNYYPVPVSFMIVVTLAVQVMCRGALKAFITPMLIMAALTGYLLFQVKPFAPFTFLPKWIDKKVIVWTYFSNGTLDYYQGRAGSKLLHSSPDVQDKLVKLVKMNGRDQVFIDDFDFFRKSCDRIAQTYGIYPAGYANLMGEREIWLLKAKDNSKEKGVTSCNPDIHYFPIEQMKNVSLKINSMDSSNGVATLNLTLTNNSSWPLFTGSPAHPLRLSWQYSMPTALDNAKQWTTRVELPPETFLMDGMSSSFKIEIPYRDSNAAVLSLSLVEENYAWFHDFGFTPAVYNIKK